MQRLKLHLFGYPQVELDGAPAGFETRKALALLAYLAVENRAHSRESLAALFWPEYDAQRAYHNLRRSLWAINKALGKDWITAERESLQLNRTAGVWTDVSAFAGHLAACEGHGHGPETSCPACLPHLAAAGELCRGAFLEGFGLPDSPTFEDWQFFKAEELKGKACETLEKLANLEAEHGDLPAAVRAVQRWLHLQPLHEPAHLRLMELYAQAGQRLQALRQYEGLKAALERELGEPPQPETTRLYERIRAGAAAAGSEPVRTGAAGSGAAGSGAAGSGAAEEHTAAHPQVEIAVETEPEKPASNLPHNLTPFVGRRHELEEIKMPLTDPGVRLLTLLGPGGIGKTRLAIQAAREVESSFQNGVFFVHLAPLTTPDAVLPAIAKTLKLQLKPSGEPPIQQLGAYLRSKEVLLILDNFEHLVSDESLQAVLELLEATPRVKVMVTTRSRLGLKGENMYPVAGMRLPLDDQPWAGTQDLAQFSGLQMFVQSAGRVQPGFLLTPENYPIVVQICQAVEGMPLGIELATAWMEMLTPAEVLAEIHKSLDFLETTQHNVPERQRSLRAVFEVSWNMLSPAERDLFRQLTIFSGGFTRTAAQTVAGASLAGLSSLVNKSFLYWRPEGRYELHELLRQYGAAELQQAPELEQAARDRHSACYLGLLEEHGPLIYSPKFLETIELLDAEADNTRAAWFWALERKNIAGLDRALFGLFSYFNLRGFFVEIPAILDRTRQGLERAQDTRAGRVLMAKLLPLLSAVTTDTITDRRAQMILRSLELARAEGAEREMGESFCLLAREYATRIDPHEGLRMLSENQGWLRQVSPFSDAFTLQCLGGMQLWVGDNQAARQSLEESLAVSRANGNLVGIADTLATLAGLYYRERDYPESKRLLEECREHFMVLGDRQREMIILHEMGSYADSVGDFDLAVRSYQMMYRLNQDLGNLVGQSVALSWESIAHFRYGDLERARALRLESLKYAREAANPTNILWGLLELGEIERLSGRYAAAKEHFAACHHMHIDTRMSEVGAFYHKSLGDLALAQGQFTEAEEYFIKSEAFARRDFSFWCAAYVLTGQGTAALGQGDPSRAGDAIRQGLAETHRLANVALSTYALAAAAHYYAARGQERRALELAALLLDHPATWNSTRDGLSELVARCAARLPAIEFSLAQARGRQADLEAEIEKVLAEQTPVPGPANEKLW